MSENNNLPLAERFELLLLYSELVVLRQSGRHPETHKRYIEQDFDVLRKNRASEKALMDMESYLTKVGAGVLPMDEKRSTKLLWKVIRGLVENYYKKNGMKK